jgi:hypothetical protein
VTGGWRELHNEELRNMYFSPNIIITKKPMTMRGAGHEKTSAYKILGGKPEEQRLLSRSRCRSEDIIKINL